MPALSGNMSIDGLAAVCDSSSEDDYAKGVEAYRSGDYRTAVAHWKKAAKDGNANAQCNLGACYAQGLGVSQSYESAFEWYRKAAVQGNDVAQCNLGNCYSTHTA